MLASTVKFSTYGRDRGAGTIRCRQPVRLKIDCLPRSTLCLKRTVPSGARRPNLQSPPACLGFVGEQVEVPPPDSKSFEPGCTDDESTTLPTSQCSTSGACSAADFLAADPSAGQIRRSANWLLRKEVIQPHLPVRLPCYDLVLIASPTFDGSLPKGLGHRLRVLPTFMT